MGFVRITLWTGAKCLEFLSGISCREILILGLEIRSWEKKKSAPHGATHGISEISSIWNNVTAGVEAVEAKPSLFGEEEWDP